MGRVAWAGAATVVALVVVLGQVSSVGPVVLSVSREHGLHAGDAVVLGIWAVTVSWLLWTALGRREGACTRS